MTSSAEFFREVAAALKPKAELLLAEPSGHVEATDFEGELESAAQAGFRVAAWPAVPRSHAALLAKS
jgi:hypothetical protein